VSLGLLAITGCSCSAEEGITGGAWLTAIGGAVFFLWLVSVAEMSGGREVV
jgi:hypothetical protein